MRNYLLYLKKYIKDRSENPIASTIKYRSELISF